MLISFVDEKYFSSIFFFLFRAGSSTFGSDFARRNRIDENARIASRLLHRRWHHARTRQRVSSTRLVSSRLISVCSARDHGIFINKIIPGGIAAEDGRLRIGDRLLAVQSEVKAKRTLLFSIRCVQSDTYNLEFVEHKHAVEAIRRACEESRTIKLVVGHVTASTQSPLNPSVSSRPAAATNGHSASRDDDASG